MCTQVCPSSFRSYRLHAYFICIDELKVDFESWCQEGPCCAQAAHTNSLTRVTVQTPSHPVLTCLHSFSLGSGPWSCLNLRGSTDKFFYQGNKSTCCSSGKMVQKSPKDMHIQTPRPSQELDDSAAQNEYRFVDCLAPGFISFVCDLRCLQRNWWVYIYILEWEKLGIS